MRAPEPTDEAERLRALRDYDILDTPPEQAFDDVAALASYICGTPIGIVSLVEADRQWFKAHIGVDVEETHRDIAFCAHTILDDQVMVVPDATADPRFVDNPLVTAEPNIRFYAGAPLLDPQGHALGVLCAIDRQPRSLAPEQLAALESLARQVVALMELRRISAQLAESLRTIQVISGLVPVCAWCKGIRNDEGYWTSVEQYLAAQGEAVITHGICPDCLAKWADEPPAAAADA